MADKWDDIIGMLPRIQKVAQETRETLLSNLIMIGEMPAPTFHEKNRITFLQNRFAECGIVNCSKDEVGNIIGVIEGEDSDENIMMLAHVDTVFSRSTDHTITVLPDRVNGPGVGDNSLGVAFLATLPTLLNNLDMKLNLNLILMGATRSLGRGNLEGLRFFLSNSNLPIRAGICVEGAQLGRLSYLSIGMRRGEISCSVPEEFDWTRFGAAGAIRTINEVINKINEIRLPRKPQTSIFMGSIQAGQSYNTIPTMAVLRFEIRSESDELVNEIAAEIQTIGEEVSSQTGAEVTVDIFARRMAGGVPFMHPLVQCTRKLMAELEIETRIAPSISELSAFIDHKIPAITLGLTIGENLNRPDERIRLEPLDKGLTQLIALLLAIDQGVCHVD